MVVGFLSRLTRRLQAANWASWAARSDAMAVAAGICAVADRAADGVVDEAARDHLVGLVQVATVDQQR